MTSSTNISNYKARNIPSDLIGFDYVTEIQYNSNTYETILIYKSGLTNNLGPVLTGDARKIIDVYINGNQDLIISFNTLESINVGPALVTYNYVSPTISGSGILSHAGAGVFKPVTTSDPNIIITNDNGDIDFDITLPAEQGIGPLEGTPVYANYGWFVEEWSSTTTTSVAVPVAGAWQTRILNSTRLNNLGAAINNATGIITLPRGTYYISAFGKSIRADSAKVAVRDITNNTTILDSITMVNYAAAASSQVSPSVKGYIRLENETQIALQQLSETTGANTNAGTATGALALAGTTGTHAELNIWKVSDEVLPYEVPENTDLDAIILAIQENYYNFSGTVSSSLSNMGVSLSDTEKWIGGTLATNGKIYSVPFNATDILIIDPSTNTATRSNMGATLTGTFKWAGGVLAPNGKIYCIPRNATDILIIDPSTNTATRSNMGANLSGSTKWVSGVLALNGKIYGIPEDSTDILIIDTITDTATRSNMGANLSGSTKWYGGTLASNGKIYAAPWNSTDVLIIDPDTNTATRSNMGATLTGTFKWTSLCLGANGMLYGVPYDATDILIINPLTNTATRSNMGATLTGTFKWIGSALGADGKIYCAPRNSTTILIINPMSGTAIRSNLGTTLPGTTGWFGAVTGLNGIIYGIPFDTASVLQISNSNNLSLPSNLTLSPYLNKF